MVCSAFLSGHAFPFCLNLSERRRYHWGGIKERFGPEKTWKLSVKSSWHHCFPQYSFVFLLQYAANRVWQSFASGGLRLISWTLLWHEAWGWSCLFCRSARWWSETVQGSSRPPLTNNWLRVITVWIAVFLIHFIALTRHPWCHAFWCLIEDPAHIQKLFACIGAHTDAKTFPSTIFSCQFHHSYYSDRHSVRASALCCKAKSRLKFFCFSNPDVLFPSSLLQLFKGNWISAEAVMSATSMVPPCWLHQEMSGRHLFWVLEQPQLSSVLNNSIVNAWSSLNCFSGRGFILRQMSHSLSQLSYWISERPEILSLRNYYFPSESWTVSQERNMIPGVGMFILITSWPYSSANH